MRLQAGDSFLGGLPGHTKHLWFVLTRPNDDGKVVIANVTSSQCYRDENCVIEPGDHPFVRKRSIILYDNAMLSLIDRLDEAVERGEVQQREPASGDLYRRIVEGGLESDDTVGKIRTELERGSMSTLEYEGLRKSHR